MSQVGKINLYDSTSGGGTPQLKLFTDSSNKQNITAATNLTLTTTSGNINFVNSLDTTKNITDIGGVISTAVSTNTTQGISLASTILIANSASASNATQSTALSILEINKSVDSVVYVSAHYNGGNSDGSKLKPYTTIADAMSNASSGDTIYLYDGTHTLDGSSDVLPADKTLTFQGESTEKTIITSGSLTSNCFYQSDSSVTDYSYYFNDLTVKDSQYGIRLKSAKECIVRRCKFVNNGWNGTAASEESKDAYATLWASANTSDGGALRLEGCSVLAEVRDSVATENLRGFRLQKNGEAIICNNVSYKNMESGIYLAASAVGATLVGNTSATVSNNISYENKNNGILIIGGTHANIVSNNVYENYNSGIQVWYGNNANINGNIIRANCQKTYNGIGNDGDSYAGISLDGVVSNCDYFTSVNGNTIVNNLQGRSSEAIGINIAYANTYSLSGTITYIGNNLIQEHDSNVSDTNSFAQYILDTAASTSLSTLLITTNSTILIADSASLAAATNLTNLNSTILIADSASLAAATNLTNLNSTILIADSASAAAAAIIAGAGTDLDTLSEIVAAYGAADTTVLANVTAVSTLVSTLSTTLSTLTEE
jgi:hypothetical protein